MAAPESDDIQQIYKGINELLSNTHEYLIYTIDERERQDRELKGSERMVRHNDGDTSSETHSNDKRANESHLSESTEMITARRYTEGEAGSEQGSWQDIQENKIEESTSMFPTSTSVIPVMDNRPYTPRLLSTRGSVIMASTRPTLREVGRGAFTLGLRFGFPPQQLHVFLSQDRESQAPPRTAATSLHEEPLQLCLVKCHSQINHQHG